MVIGRWNDSDEWEVKMRIDVGHGVRKWWSDDRDDDNKIKKDEQVIMTIILREKWFTILVIMAWTVWGEGGTRKLHVYLIWRKVEKDVEGEKERKLQGHLKDKLI